MVECKRCNVKIQAHKDGFGVYIPFSGIWCYGCVHDRLFPSDRLKDQQELHNNTKPPIKRLRP